MDEPLRTQPIKGIEDLDIFALSVEEAESLRKFLYSNGYISYEYHNDIVVLLKRLEKWFKERK